MSYRISAIEYLIPLMKTNLKLNTNELLSKSMWKINSCMFRFKLNSQISNTETNLLMTILLQMNSRAKLITDYLKLRILSIMVTLVCSLKFHNSFQNAVSKC